MWDISNEIEDGSNQSFKCQMYSLTDCDKIPKYLELWGGTRHLIW